MRILFLLIATSLLLPTSALAEPLQLCVKADRFVEGKPREGTKIVLRSQCKVRSNGTLIEISLGTTDALGGGDSCGSIAGVYLWEDSAFLARITMEPDDASGEIVIWTGLSLSDDPFATCAINRGVGSIWLAQCPVPFSGLRLLRTDCEELINLKGPSSLLQRISLTCGDGIFDSLAGEECDDGNVIADDGCGPTCLTEFCGDGIQQSAEACDDSNNTDGDGCSADCLSDETCGNGIVDAAAGEECEAGLIGGATCEGPFGPGVVLCGDACLLDTGDCVPSADIHIQLVWDTPADSDQTDTGFGAGADMDLHFLHPFGDWFCPPYDTYYGNSNPDWGTPFDHSDDPSYDLSDNDGAGPEVINLDLPENNRVYRVGVHYFNDHGYGTSFSTVRIFSQGVLQFELADKPMVSTGAFWDVATIEWPSGNVTVIDDLSTAPPPQICP